MGGSCAPGTTGRESRALVDLPWLALRVDDPRLAAVPRERGFAGRAHGAPP